MSAEDYKSQQDFLEKMDAGDLDGNFIGELKKLTREQLEEVAQALADRESQKRARRRRR
jgi:hypothetical protein